MSFCLMWSQAHFYMKYAKSVDGHIYINMEILKCTLCKN